MAEVVEPATTGANGVAFELDRFEMADGERFEVGGRWFGVRGRRFMRPSLTLVADEEQRRLLADLEHKPWAAEDGQPWEATFPYEPDDAGWIEAELNVAPDITITLPLPGATRPGAGGAGLHRRPRSPVNRRPQRPVPQAPGAPVHRAPPPPAAASRPKGPLLPAVPARPRPSWSTRDARRIARSASSSARRPRSQSCRPSSSAAEPSSRRSQARAMPPVPHARKPPGSTKGSRVPAVKR